MRKTPSIHDILTAAQVIDGIASTTPLVPMRGSGLLLKCESHQVTGSFKFRGALTAVAAAKNLGVAHVVTGSSGNHGLALARAAGAYGMRATVFMTRSSSSWKRDRVRSEGAEVVVCDHGNEERDESALRYATRVGARFVSSHDDAAVIAGQGTVALEVLRQAPRVTHIYVPVGGGGLLAGTCVATRAAGVRVIGVEPTGADRYTRSLRAGRAVRLDRVSTACDGVRAPAPGRLPFACAHGAVGGMVTVTDEQVLAAMELLIAGGLPCEVTGALAVAGVLATGMETDATTVAIVSGGNAHSAAAPEHTSGQHRPDPSPRTGWATTQIQKI